MDRCDVERKEKELSWAFFFSFLFSSSVILLYQRAKSFFETLANKSGSAI